MFIMLRQTAQAETRRGLALFCKRSLVAVVVGMREIVQPLNSPQADNWTYYKSISESMINSVLRYHNLL